MDPPSGIVKLIIYIYTFWHSLSISNSPPQICCLLYWEFTKINPPLNIWLEVVQQVLRYEVYVVLDLSVFIFWICGQLIVTFYKDLANKVILGAVATREFSVFSTLSPRLSASATFLCSQFALILLMNYFHAFACLIFFNYENLKEIRRPEFKVLFIWNVIVATDCVVRLWLICQTADQIRHSV